MKKEWDKTLQGNHPKGAAHDEWVKTRPIEDAIELSDVNRDTVLGQVGYYCGEH